MNKKPDRFFDPEDEPSLSTAEIDNSETPEDEKNMKHTDKWVVSAYEGGWDCVRNEQGQIICKLVLNEPANAQRIVTCCNNFDDLLEACEHSLRIFELYKNHPQMNTIREKLTEVIAKAEKS